MIHVVAALGRQGRPAIDHRRTLVSDAGQLKDLADQRVADLGRPVHTSLLQQQVPLWVASASLLPEPLRGPEPRRG